MNNNLVSIIMPVYDLKHREDLFQRAINSIKKQTYKNFELIIVIDGKNDSDIDIISKATIEKQIYMLDENKGLYAARNFGIEKSNGELVVFHDSDDVCSPNRLEIFVSELIKQNEEPIIVSYVSSVGPNGLRVKKPYEDLDFWLDIFLQQVKPPFCLAGGLICYKRFFNELGGYIGDKTMEDRCLACKVGLFYKFVLNRNLPIIKQSLYTWNRQNPWSITYDCSNKRNIKLCEEIIQKQEKRFENIRNIIKNKEIYNMSKESIKEMIIKL